ncbi:MAG: hypothetical protein ABEI27_01060 [Halobellus sp.]|uniref:hypothetical protein n=1 Tax=Halobellus sp. TaxID=1979212 RepID=UPI0035D4DA4F
MSHRSRDRNLSEWADLVGASLPDSVDDSDGTSASGDAYGSPESVDAFGAEFGSETDRSR